MINKEEHPVAWAMLQYELEDARDHLTELLNEFQSEGFGEIEFGISLAHVIAHINRAWNSRNVPEELTDDQWNAMRAYPSDLEPLV